MESNEILKTTGKPIIGYGGSDSSCKNIRFSGRSIVLADLLNMLVTAKEKKIDKVCISVWCFDSLINSISEIMGKGEVGLHGIK